MIRLKTTIIFLLVSISAAYSATWDDIDANLSNNKCKVLKETIKNRTFSLKKEYSSLSAKGAISYIDYSIKIVDEYSKKGCLILDSDRKFYNQEIIYWGTQKYKVKRVLGENPERPTWSADEAIKVEQQREVKKQPQKKVVKKKIPKKQKPKRSKDPLENALMGSGTSTVPQQYRPSTPLSAAAYGSKMIKRLYGSEFESYSQTQKKFIKKI